MQPFKALNVNLVHGYHIAGRGFSDSWVVNPGVRAKGNCDAIDITAEGHALIHFDGNEKWIPMANIKGATPIKEPVQVVVAVEEQPITAKDVVAAVDAMRHGPGISDAQGDANKPAPKAAAKKTAPAATATAGA